MYIDLNRQFSILPIKQKEEVLDPEEISKSTNLSNLFGWEKLLEYSRVVILAEAGAGKTIEIQEKAKQLKAKNYSSFFMRLEFLAEGLSSFEYCFEDLENYDLFNQWVTTNEIGYFFLDSVDEARLKNLSDFEKAIRTLSNKLRNHLPRAKIFITSRISEWRPSSDLELFKTHLPSTIDKDTIQPDDKTHKIIILKALSEGQIREFAVKREVQDIELFIQEIRRQEADIFARRPLDLEELIEFWQRHNRIASRYELIENSIRQKLIERNPNLAQLRSITEDKLLEGAQFVAAVATLQKQSRIYLSGSTGLSLDIHIDTVLPTWLPDERKILLKTALFDEEIYGSVRFYHRVVREFLTAQWLIKLLQAGKSRRVIESLLFQEQYGLDVTVPTMRPIIAWLACSDSRILEKVIIIDPQILIEYGDPKRIPLTNRERIIENCCRQYVESLPVNKNSFSFDTLERFASPDLGTACINLFAKYPYHYEVSIFLIKLITNGKIITCRDKIFEISSDVKYESYIRSLAIQALDVLIEKDSFLEFIRTWLDKNEIDVRLSYTLLGSDYGKYIPKDLILIILDKINNELTDTNDLSYFGNYLQNWIEYNSNIKLLDILEKITKFVKKLSKSEEYNSSINSDESWCLKTLEVVCEAITKNKYSDELGSILNEALSLLAIYNDEFYFSGLKDVEIRLGVVSWPELNNSQFWYDIRKIEKKYLDNGEDTNGDNILVSVNTYSNFSAKDFDYLAEMCFKLDEYIEKEIAFDILYRIYDHSKEDWMWYQKIYSIVEIFPELKLKLNSIIKNKRRFKRSRILNTLHKRRNIIRKQKTQQDFQNTKNILLENLEELRGNPYPQVGEIWKVTHYLLNKMRYGENDNLTTSQYGSSEWEKLISMYGIEVATAFKEGAVRYWRLNKPSLASEVGLEESQGNYTTSYGLTGLAIENNENPDWLQTISSYEAEIATRYAIQEFHGFTSWMPNLYKRFPEVLIEILLKEIKWEIASSRAEASINYIISKILFDAKYLYHTISLNVYEYLLEYNIENLSLLENLLFIIFQEKIFNNEKIILLINENILRKNSAYQLWLSLSIVYQSEQSISILKKHLNDLSNVEAEKYISKILSYLFNRNRRLVVDQTEGIFSSAISLSRLYLLVCEYIKYEDDISRLNGIAYTPNSRDDAESARGAIFNFLTNLSGKDAFNAWELIAKSINQPYLIERAYEEAWKCACQAADISSWSTLEVEEFSKYAEFQPTNHKQLFNLIDQRLLDLKDDLETGDTSLASILIKHERESQHRLFIGSWLRDRSINRYIVPQEEELANAQRPDIRVHGQGFDAPIPIELKIAGKWSGNELYERLRNQLIGDYLRDSRSNRGIFLLTNIHKDKQWVIDLNGTKKRVYFNELVIHMQNYASQLVKAHLKVEEVRVIGIDLTIREEHASDI